MKAADLEGLRTHTTCTSSELAQVRDIIEEVRMDHRKALLVMDGLDRLLERLQSGEAVGLTEFRDGMMALRSLLDHEIIEHFGFEETELFPALERHCDVLDVSLPIMRQITQEHDSFADGRAEFNLALEALDEAGDDLTIVLRIAPHVQRLCEFLRMHIELEDRLVEPAIDALAKLA